MPRAKSTDGGRHRGPSAGASSAAGPTIWARFLRPVIDYATGRGCARAEALAVCGLGEDALESPDARVGLVAGYELLELVAERYAASPAFALEVAATYTVEVYGALGFLMATSANVRESFERFAAYQRLWNDGERFTLERRGDRLAISYEPFGPPRPAHHHMATLAFADILVNGAVMIGRPLPAARVSFRAPAPTDPGPFHALLGPEIRWSSALDELTADASALDWPMPDANPSMAAFFDRYNRERLDSLPRRADATIVARVRAQVERELHRGVPQLEAVARDAGLSPRTLQRRLRAEGVTLHQLVDTVRRVHAHAFLDQGMAIAEVAYLLGYSEPSAFHRAFKRWTQTTPELYRARAR